MHQILIAEDEARIAAFMEKGFRRHGYTTVVAKDGIEAVEMAVTQNFDLLLLDLGLPGKDGWLVLEELKTKVKTPPSVIIVTAQDNLEEHLKSQTFHVDGYILKPFSFYELLAQVQKQLSDKSPIAGNVLNL